MKNKIYDKHIQMIKKTIIMMQIFKFKVLKNYTI